MARPYRRRIVSTINRAYSRDPLERVESVGGVNADYTHWQLTQADAIAKIEAGTDEFFVQDGDVAVRLIVFARGGEKYLQSERELTHPDDLVNLVNAQLR